MKIYRYSHEQWLIFTLTSLVALILFLVVTIAYQAQWSLLAISTLVFFSFYPLTWLAWRAYSFWRQAIMQLTTYTAILKEGETSLAFKAQNPANLLTELQQEIAELAKVNQQQQQQEQTLENVLSHILDAWPVPVCLFDQGLKLRYRNDAIKSKIQQPMLVDSPASDLGFKFSNEQLSHSVFNANWQCQTINYQHNNESAWLFSAFDISQPLHQQQTITQQNLIRVLSHELRNSLTPMSSMADTLLSNNNFEAEQVRLVLTRIQQRSDRLLNFIEQYSQLAKLSPPKAKWLDITELIGEASALIKQACRIDFSGNKQCFADGDQLSHILINLFKNSAEACQNKPCVVDIKLYHKKNKQIMIISDNGCGFANFDNALTPFYTTKANGSGIGLSLCAEIARNHGGDLTIENIFDHTQQICGAKIVLTWPIN